MTKALTPNDGIGTKLNKLIVELFSQPLDVLFLALTRFLEPFRICWGDVMIAIVIKDSLVRCPTRWIHSETQRRYSVPVVRQLTRNEVLAFRLTSFMVEL
jgi:hypothetical protein